jgi:hypothetical protein
VDRAPSFNVPPEKDAALSPVLWLLLSPLIFIAPGLWPARRLTGGAYTGWTFVWAFFFSVLVMPPLAFGLAMLLGTTMNAALLLPLGAVLGLLGLFSPRRVKGARTDADPGPM